MKKDEMIKSTKLGAGMKFRNTVKVTASGKTHYAHNTAFDPGQCIADGRPYTKYIVLTFSDGSKAAVEAELTEKNNDPRYPLFVTKCAVLEPLAYAGKSLVSAGFSPDGAEVVNLAVFAEPILKTEGERLTAVVTVGVEMSGGTLKLCAGDNPLADCLLGLAKLTYMALNIHSGKNYENNRVMARERTGISATAACTVSFSSGQLLFTAHFTSEVYEALLETGGKIVARAMFMGNDTTATGDISVVGRRNLVKIYDYPLEVYSVYHNDVRVNSFKLTRYPEEVFASGKFPFKLAGGAILGSDAGHNYAIAASSGEVTLMQRGDDGWEMLGSYVNYGLKADVCTDGAVIVYGEEITVHRLDGTTAKYAVPRPDTAVTVVEDGQYHTAAKYGRTLRRYRLSPDGSTELVAEREFDGDFMIFRHSQSAIAYGKGSDWEVKNLTGGSVSLAANLSSIFAGEWAAANGTPIKAEGGDGILLVTTNSLLYSVNYEDMGDGTVGIEAFYGSGTFVGFEKNSGLYFWVKRPGGVTVAGMTGVKIRPVSVCRAGGGVLVMLENGEVLDVRMFDSCAYLSSSEFVEGGTVRYFCLRPKKIYTAGGRVKVTMRIRTG